MVCVARQPQRRAHRAAPARRDRGRTPRRGASRRRERAGAPGSPIPASRSPRPRRFPRGSTTLTSSPAVAPPSTRSIGLRVHPGVARPDGLHVPWLEADRRHGPGVLVPRQSDSDRWIGRGTRKSAGVELGCKGAAPGRLGPARVGVDDYCLAVNVWQHGPDRRGTGAGEAARRPLISQGRDQAGWHFGCTARPPEGTSRMSKSIVSSASLAFVHRAARARGGAEARRGGRLMPTGELVLRARLPAAGRPRGQARESQPPAAARAGDDCAPRAPVTYRARRRRRRRSSCTSRRLRRPPSWSCAPERDAPPPYEYAPPPPRGLPGPATSGA